MRHLRLLPHHSPIYHPDLVAAADLVVGKLGYSTVAESFAAGTRMLYVPRPTFRESAVLEAWVAARLPAEAMPFEALRAGRWVGRVAGLLARPRPVPRPSFLGVRHFERYPLEELVDRIDWTPFFQSWEMSGHYPAILEDPVSVPAARDLFRDGQAMLERMLAEKRISAAAAVGFYPAAADIDDDDVLRPNFLESEAMRLHQNPVLARYAYRNMT